METLESRTGAFTSIAEDEIKAFTDQWADAVSKRDIERIMQFYADDIVLFDLAPPLRYIGSDGYRKSLEEWFPTFDGPISYEFTERAITASGNVGFVHSVNHMTGKRTNGEDTDVWLRATVCLEKINGHWLVVHEHVSVPFYMDGSYKAAVDLKP